MTKYNKAYFNSFKNKQMTFNVYYNGDKISQIGDMWVYYNGDKISQIGFFWVYYNGNHISQISK